MIKTLLLAFGFTAITSGWGNAALAQIPSDSLALWLKADDGVVTNGTDVTQWNDNSGNGRDAVAMLGTYPTLVNNELCGQPVIRFNGNNGMLTPEFQTFPEKRGTMFIVAKVTGGGGTGGFGTLVSTYVGNGVQWQSGVFTSGSNYTWYDGVGSSGNPIAASPPGDWGIVTYDRNQDNLLKFYKSGALIADIAVANNQSSANTLKIGYNAYSAQYEFLIGDIAEIIIYNASLTDEEIYVVNTYLANKYCLNSQVAMPVADDENVCGTGTAVLTASGALNYRWYATASDNIILGTDPIFTTPALAQTDTFYVANYNDTLESVRTYVIVTVTPLPAVTVSADEEICAGEQVTLSATNVVGVLIWSPGNEVTPTIQVSPMGTQVYTASATNDCGTSTEDVTVTVNMPVVPEVTDNGLVLSSSAAASYQWYFEGDLIDDATEQQYIPMEEGNYTVETVDANGCTAVSTDYFYAVTAIVTTDAHAISLYPNPSSGLFHVTLGSTATAQLEIYDALGKNIHASSVIGGQARIDISAYPKGMYLVNVLQGETIATRKIVVE